LIGWNGSGGVRVMMRWGAGSEERGGVVIGAPLPATVAAVQGYLEEYGSEVLVSAEPAEVVVQVGSRAPHLVVLSMPSLLDLLDLCRHVRAISAVPLAAGLRARDRDLAPGSTVFFGASAAITARDVSVRVRFQSRFRPRRFLAPLGLIAAGAALLSIAVGLSPSWGGAGEAEPSVLSDLAMRPTLADPEAAAIELRRRIAAAGLTDAITVVRDDQRIVLAGRIDLEDAARVKDIIGAFARQAARVETDLWIDAAALTPGLAAIALAPRAYVVTRDGQRLQIGDRFADGSRLEAIDDESVRLNRDGIALNVKF